MTEYLRRHHVALVALFLALGGTSYAAIKLPANSVGTSQIKRNAVTSAKVRDGSLREQDFANGQLPASTGPGPRGAQVRQGRRAHRASRAIRDHRAAKASRA